MSYVVRWRSGELDFVIEGDPTMPLIVVRPRLNVADSRLEASIFAETIAQTLNGRSTPHRLAVDVLGVLHHPAVR